MPSTFLFCNLCVMFRIVVISLINQIPLVTPVLGIETEFCGVLFSHLNIIFDSVSACFCAKSFVLMGSSAVVARVQCVH